jgi:hypothetical protein
MKLRIVPYNYRAWGRSFFSKAENRESVMDLFDVHHKLNHDHGCDATAIGTWCTEKMFHNNAFTHPDEVL